MASIGYAQARADHEYLWQTYGPADDMTGGYVDQDDLTKLLEKPTRATARDCYVAQIERWLRLGPEDGARGGWPDDPLVQEIAGRHFMEDEFRALCRSRARP